MTPLQSKLWNRVMWESGSLLGFVSTLPLIVGPWPFWKAFFWIFVASLAMGFLAGLAAVNRAERIQSGRGHPVEGPFSAYGGAALEIPLSASAALQLSEDALRFGDAEQEIRRFPERCLLTALRAGSLDGDVGALVHVRLDAVAERPGTCRAIIECVPSNPFSPSYHSTYARLAQGIAATLGRAVAEVVEQQRQEAARAQLQAQLDRARLGLLQAQVQPHFLYNTLATLKLLIRSDGAAAERMTADLIRFLQLSLPNARAEDSTLARELDIVDAYLDIMKIRMGPRLQVRLARPEGAERINVPPLVIHTLVENAIKHGLEPKPAGGRIEVTAERTAHGTLRIAVADDGAGLRLESRGTGVGLTNLRERLALLYGDRASFSIAPREPSGVACVLELPWEEELAHAD